MTNVQLRMKAWFGDEPFEIDFPESWQVSVIRPQKQPALTLDIMRMRLSQPIGTPPLSELAKTSFRAAIVVDDLTRPTPAADILPLIIEELKHGGMSESSITIIIGGGTHSPETPGSMAKKVGSQLSPLIRVVAHDCQADLENMGLSPSGLPLQINRTLLECDLKIGVGCIYPHPVAGFSGGAKIILPAVCGNETIRMMHDYLHGSRVRGGSIHTELRKEMTAVAKQVGLNFIVNVTLNHNREISGLFAGDMVLAHEEGVRVAKELYRVAVDPDADVVVADMYPFDTSWQFAHDRGMWPLDVAKKNASKVVIATCPLGLGTHELFPVKHPILARIGRRLRNFRVADLQRPVEKMKSGIRIIMQKQHRLMVYSSVLTQEEVQSVFPFAQVFPEWKDIRSALILRHGDGPVKVAVYRCAPFLLPAHNGELSRRDVDFGNDPRVGV